VNQSKEVLTQYFGLLALSGTVTSFVRPFLVGLIAATTMSRRAGIAVLVPFYLVGAMPVSHVRVAPLPPTAGVARPARTYAQRLMLMYQVAARTRASPRRNARQQSSRRPSKKLRHDK
jgi:hypothetical protein